MTHPGSQSKVLYMRISPALTEYLSLFCAMHCHSHNLASTYQGNRLVAKA